MLYFIDPLTLLRVPVEYVRPCTKPADYGSRRQLGSSVVRLPGGTPVVKRNDTLYLAPA